MRSRDGLAPPGMLVRSEWLEAEGHTVTHAAQLLGVSRRAFAALICGHAAISPEMAVRLGRVTSTSAAEWLTRQALYNLSCVDEKTLANLPPRRRKVKADGDPA